MENPLPLPVWFKAVLCFCFSLVLAAAMPASKARCEGDPWYSDLRGHWAEEIIYVLWQEGVTDGFLYTWGGKTTPYFFPDSDCTRAQLTVLLAKVFGLTPISPASPSYPDVPKSYTIYPGKPAWRWIEAALAAGLSSVPAGHYFYPDNGISRQDAVDLLIRCLDLYEYALSMPDSEVRSLLQAFGDGMNTRHDRRHSMACAIKFGIIQGYDDRTIRPETVLLRCQAAAIVYRSCLIRATASLDVFSPDGDDVDDTVKFSLIYLKNRGISNWNMAVEDASGGIVRTFNPGGNPGSPPATITWDGTNAQGKTVPAGKYYYQAWVRDRNNRQFFSVKKPLDVEIHSLSGSVSPASCRDDQTLTVKAYTTPSAKSVTASFADGNTRHLSPSSDRRTWTLQLVMGPFLPAGPQQVSLTAEFAKVSRQITLSFTRVENLWISPSLSPNPAGPGQILEALCVASSNVGAVTASLFGSVINLSKSGGLWQGISAVPLECSQGDYPVVFTGYSGNRQVSATIYLTVDTSKLAKLVFTLTR
ncbi:MAG: FlgD immunoglobulin-like domain containing protein [Bacillota bacterium]|jgi:hypothetical protein|nr:hypothetical protein [Candidatus Fermentithermobacillaceae bacterium]